MPWLQLSVKTTKSQQANLENLLLSTGALAVTLEDSEDKPILEPGVGETPLWQNITMTALYESDINPATVEWQLNQCHIHDDDFKWSPLEDKDWEREWMNDYHPIAFGKRLWVVPGWITPPQEDAINLILDPGLAFGTGTHPTTALCLHWLDSLDLNHKTIIDYGCGSGILGVAALLLGAKYLTAIDNDPQALIATEQNANRNNIQSSTYQLFTPKLCPATLTADIIVANILAAPLISLAHHFHGLLNPGGIIALSGILVEQQESILEAYSTLFNITDITEQEGWLRITAKKPIL